MTAPTLPGSIPGLLRRGSPVIQTTETRGEYVIPVGSRYTVLVVDDGSRCAADAVVLGAPGCFSGAHKREHIGLDLSDATGRAHAAWWLAAWWEAHRGNGTPSEVPLRGCVWSRCGLTSWRLMWSGCAVTFDPEGCGDAATYVAVPSLADQPDDAEALRRVCLHVAGVNP